MKRYLFVADFHGNMPATRALENALPRLHADEIWFMGDAVGKGPSSAETCDWVRSHCDHFIGGNWDYGIGGKQFPADVYYWDQLGPERLAWLTQLPREAELWLSGIRFRLFHGRPVEELMFDQMDSEVLSGPFQKNHEQYGGVLFADSHKPFFRSLHAGYIMNTGSIGNSLGQPNAHALLLEAEPGEKKAPLLATIISLPYDNQLAAQQARSDTALPRGEAYVREVLTGYYSR